MHKRSLVQNRRSARRESSSTAARDWRIVGTIDRDHDDRSIEMTAWFYSPSAGAVATARSDDGQRTTRGRLLRLRLASVLLGYRDEHWTAPLMSPIDQPRDVAGMTVVVVHPRVTGQPPSMLAACRTNGFRHTATSGAQAIPVQVHGSPQECDRRWLQPRLSSLPCCLHAAYLAARRSSVIGGGSGLDPLHQVTGLLRRRPEVMAVVAGDGINVRNSAADVEVVRFEQTPDGKGPDCHRDREA